MTTLRQQYEEMRASYEHAKNEILGVQKSQIDDPDIKLDWANQEGYKPQYDPNANEVSWIKEPEPAYNTPDIMVLQGSMSPERLAEVFPEYAYSKQHLQPKIEAIIKATQGQEITMQRAIELALEISRANKDDAYASGKVSGSAAKSTSFAQTIKRTTKNQRVAGK